MRLLFFVAVSLLLLAVPAVQCVSFDLGQTLKLFNEFKLKHGKKYSFSEESQKFKNFLDNLKEIEVLNRSQSGAKFGVSQFSDMTALEFVEKILMTPTAARKFDALRTLLLKETSNLAPENFDWRDHGAVTPVKNQGFSGTCWTFSTTGNIEGQWYLAGNPLVALSEELLVDCDGSTDPTTGHAECGIFGGWSYLAFDFIINNGGLPSEIDYPYCVGNGSCYPCNTPTYSETFCGPPLDFCDKSGAPCKLGNNPIAAKIDDWKALGDDEETLKQQLFEIGPLSIAINARGINSYLSGVYAPEDCDPNQLNHAVLLVGYGIDEESQVPYWTVKNSWGEGWGEKGYIRIKRGVEMCGVNRQATTSIIHKGVHKASLSEYIFTSY